MSARGPGIGFAGILRLGLVQAMLGAIVVLTTSTINRVMAVELALPALVPGLLVALHHAVQLSRPRMGYGSDVGRRRTPWIVGGMAVLALGGFGAAVGTAWAAHDRSAGLALATFAFLLVGLGVSAAGTSLLALLARLVDAPRRGSAAATVWVMMIIGFAVTAGVAGRFLDPFTPARLVAVSGTVSVIAFGLACAALWRLEAAHAARRPGRPGQWVRQWRPAMLPPRLRRASCMRWPKSGASPMRAASRSSFSSRCWPSACRTSSSSPSPARCSG